VKKTIGQEFMKQTRPQYLGISPQAEGDPQPPLQIPIPAGAHTMDLPAPGEIETLAIDLRTAIEERRSVRHYGDGSISVNDLSMLLWLTQGVKRVTDRPSTSRTVPSAGSRHAFETFIVANRVDGLAPGVYRYAAIENRLIEVDLSADVRDKVFNACFKQVHVRNCAAAFFWAAIAERMLWRYVERGYRYLLLDAGHVCQNLYLAAQTIGCVASAVASFIDDDLNKVFGLDGENQFVVYGGTVGKREARKTEPPAEVAEN
jgi:SagB-type dehydrogenase family enzyme